MQITFHYGSELAERVYPEPQKTGHYYGDANTLLAHLEACLGITGQAANVEHLRREQYRQLLAAHVASHPTAFYAASFKADALNTAAALLARRDELLSAGWLFAADSTLPDRLNTFAELEAMLRNSFTLEAGFADRLAAVLRELPNLETAPFTDIVSHEPPALLPVGVRRLFAVLGVTIHDTEKPTSSDKDPAAMTDLEHWQHVLTVSASALTPENRIRKPRKDGSLVVLRATRETDAATFLAKVLRANAGFRPLLLVPAKDRALENALANEAHPALGILSASSARPILQLLKLVTAFLWSPIDPAKILEFLTLPIKPLSDDLATRLAAEMAQRPGIRGKSWYAKVEEYFEEFAERVANDETLPPNAVEKARAEYDFWFSRTRYNQNRSVPVAEVRDAYRYLRSWAISKYDETNRRYASLLPLAEQCKRITETLDALPPNERSLSFLQLDRIVRSIYAAAPVQLDEEQAGHLPYVYAESAIIDDVPTVLWWNFATAENDHFFSRWYATERTYLQSLGVVLAMPHEESALRLWQRKRPVLQTHETLVVVVPSYIAGTAQLDHPLLGELRTAFAGWEELALNIDAPPHDLEAAAATWQKLPFAHLAQKEALDPKTWQTAEPYIYIKNATANASVAAATHPLTTFTNFTDKEYQLSYSALNDLLNYPHKWAFRYRLKLHKLSLLSVVDDHTLKGNLSHSLFELIFKEKRAHWTQPDLIQFIEEQMLLLLRTEGATLLLYGREPERALFVATMKKSAWMLIDTIQKEGWQVEATEFEIKGTFSGVPMRGIIDLVLKREGQWAILDLKWSGMTKRSELIHQKRDYQLAIYAHLLEQERGILPHTAFYIIDKGVIVARNNAAFVAAIVPAGTDTDAAAVQQTTIRRMGATFAWRLEQLERGAIEIRTKDTLPQIEEIDPALFLDLLELPSENAQYDDYDALVGVVR